MYLLHFYTYHLLLWLNMKGSLNALIFTCWARLCSSLLASVLPALQFWKTLCSHFKNFPAITDFSHFPTASSYTFPLFTIIFLVEGRK